MQDIDALCRVVINEAFRLHRDLGPGLLESVYEQVLAAKLQKAGLHVVRQQSIDMEYEDIKFEGAFRADILVEDCLLLEIKSVGEIAPVHTKQVVTYLRLLDLPIGLLLNFGGGVFKGNAKRIASGHKPLAAWRPGERTSSSLSAS